MTEQEKIVDFLQTIVAVVKQDVTIFDGANLTLSRTHSAQELDAEGIFDSPLDPPPITEYEFRVSVDFTFKFGESYESD